MPLDPEIAAFHAAEAERLAARPPDLAFPREEYRVRAARLAARMREAGIDTLLLTSPDAMAWLHGYAARWYRAHASTRWPPIQLTALHADGRLFHVDSRWHGEIVRLSSAAEDVRLVASRSLADWTAFVRAEVAREGWLGRIGVERWSSVPNPAVADALRDALVEGGADVVDATALIRAARRVKSPAEIALIEEAAQICDVGLLALRDALRPGMAELEAWGILTAAMAAAGGEHAALHECVLRGPIEVSHSLSSRRPLAAGDYVWTDPCGVVRRYHANVARTFWLGEPPPVARRIAEIEAGAFDVLTATARPGLPVRELAAALRAYYVDAGVWGLHAWTGGYELRLSLPPDWVGEWMFTVDDEDADEVIEAGMVTNYESCVVLPMIDTVVYEEAGARLLSRVPRELLVVETR